MMNSCVISTRTGVNQSFEGNYLKLVKWPGHNQVSTLLYIMCNVKFMSP